MFKSNKEFGHKRSDYNRKKFNKSLESLNNTFPVNNTRKLTLRRANRVNNKQTIVKNNKIQHDHEPRFFEKNKLPILSTTNSTNGYSEKENRLNDVNITYPEKRTPKRCRSSSSQVKSRKVQSAKGGKKDDGVPLLSNPDPPILQSCNEIPENYIIECESSNSSTQPQSRLIETEIRPNYNIEEVDSENLESNLNLINNKPKTDNIDFNQEHCDSAIYHIDPIETDGFFDSGRPIDTERIADSQPYLKWITNKQCERMKRNSIRTFMSKRKSNHPHLTGTSKTLRQHILIAKQEFFYWMNDRQLDIKPSVDVVVIDRIENSYGRFIIEFQLEGVKGKACLGTGQHLSHKCIHQLNVGQTIELNLTDSRYYNISNIRYYPFVNFIRII